MTRIERLTAILLLLHERKWTADELSDEFRVARRTVIRDVQSLCVIGVPIVAQSGQGGGYQIPDGATLSPLHLTWREALLLTLAIEGLAKMTDTPFRADRAALVAKLRALMPEGQRARLEPILSRVGIEVPARPQRTPLLEHLLELAGQWVTIRYDGEDRVLRLERIYADRGFWYFVGVSDGASRTYRADRVASVQASAAPPDIREPLPYGHESHPMVRVMLSQKGLRRVQTDPHLGPNVYEAGLLEFRCPPGELDWFARYFGVMASDAKVLAPPELIERILALSQEMSQVYE